VQLVDHGVDGVLQGEHLTLHVHLDLLGEIALGDGGRDLRDVTDLVGEVVRHGVDVLGEVLPDALDPTHVRPATECPLGAHLTGHPGHFVTEGGQLVHHRVDGVLPVEHLALHVDADLLAQITPGHRRGHLSHVAPLLGQPDRHPVDRLGHLTPGTRDPVDPGGTTQLALGTHLTGHPGHFLGETAHLLGHAVDRVGQTQQVTTEFTPTSVRGSPPVQLTRRDRVEDLCHIRHGLGDLVHHVVEGAGALGPGTPGRVDDQPLVESPLLAHDLTDPLQLTVELLTVIDDLVEHRGDLADRPAPPLTEAHTEVAVPHAVQRLEYLVELFLGRFLDRLGHRTPPQPAWFAPVPHSFSGSTAVREARPTDVGQSHRTAKSCPVSGPSEAGKHTRCPHTLVVSCHVTVARH